MTRAATTEQFALSNLKLGGLNSKTVIIITTTNLGLATRNISDVTTLSNKMFIEF